MDIVNVSTAPPFITKDGSEIRELLAHRNSAIRHQSLAEARLPAGAATQEHYHAKTEEIYFITAGAGRLRIEDETRDVQAGDAIAIPPGKKPKLYCLCLGKRWRIKLLLRAPLIEVSAKQTEQCAEQRTNHAQRILRSETPEGHRWRYADSQPQSGCIQRIQAQGLVWRLC